MLRKIIFYCFNFRLVTDNQTITKLTNFIMEQFKLKISIYIFKYQLFTILVNINLRKVQLQESLYWA